jgi:hypothetical protein
MVPNDQSEDDRAIVCGIDRGGIFCVSARVDYADFRYHLGPVTSTQFTITVPTSGFLQDTPTVSFTIAGKTYTSVLDVQFNGPTITSIFGFSDTVNGDTLTSIGLTSFQLFGTGISSTDGGTVTINAVAATPLPAALPLFAGGLGLLGMFARRRKQKASAFAAA